MLPHPANRASSPQPSQQQGLRKSRPRAGWKKRFAPACVCGVGGLPQPLPWGRTTLGFQGVAAMASPGLRAPGLSLIREIVPTLPERLPAPSHYPMLDTIFYHSWTPAQLPRGAPALRLSSDSFSTCEPQPSFHSYLHPPKPLRKSSHTSHQACPPLASVVPPGLALPSSDSSPASHH